MLHLLLDGYCMSKHLYIRQFQIALNETVQVAAKIEK